MRTVHHFVRHLNVIRPQGDAIMRKPISSMLPRTTKHGAAVAAALIAIFSGTCLVRAEQAKSNLTMKDLALAEGKTDYILYCNACHGADGKGGSMAAILVKTPTDLTALSAGNDGVFPFWRVFSAISGDVEVAGHDTFQMPEFWRRFQREEGLPGYAPASLRVLALTHYVESLQRK